MRKMKQIVVRLSIVGPFSQWPNFQSHCDESISDASGVSVGIVSRIIKTDWGSHSVKFVLLFLGDNIYHHLRPTHRYTVQEINKEAYVIHRPELNVQTLIQLGMIFKEQARYGDARRILNSGMEICFRNGLHDQINEIKLHLGHIYLLVHSLLRANELLKEVHEWSQRFGNSSIRFLAKLYLSYYELQQNRLENSRKLLTGASHATDDRAGDALVSSQPRGKNRSQCQRPI